MRGPACARLRHTAEQVEDLMLMDLRGRLGAVTLERPRLIAVRPETPARFVAV
jgi:hypothetical protein